MAHGAGPRSTSVCLSGCYRIDLQHVAPLTSTGGLQVGNKEALNCYYAHADQEDQLQVLHVGLSRNFQLQHIWPLCSAFAANQQPRRRPAAPRVHRSGAPHCATSCCAPQRRCYWMLEGDDSIVLVHYLAGNAAARLRPSGAAPLTASNLAMQLRNTEVRVTLWQFNNNQPHASTHDLQGARPFPSRAHRT